MEYEENITPDTLPEDTSDNLEGSADVQGAVSQPSQKEADGMTLSELNAVLGKDFKDKETALKSLKDTFSFVGKRKEDIVKELSGNTQAITKELEQIKQNMFYKDNPQYSEYRELIGRLGGNPEQVVAMPEFKKIFEAADGYNKDQKLKTVLGSNSRLSSSKDNLSKAREALQAGNTEAVEKHAVSAVLDMLES